jgi:hypothetical protein
MKRGKDAQRPGLANGKLPFTPILHKQANEISTPYHPLHITDLDTPKPLKPVIPISIVDPIPEPLKPDDYDSDDLHELREALLICVDVVARLERAHESKVYRSIGTQTQLNTHETDQNGLKPVPPLEVTEVLFSGDSESSPVNKPGVHQLKNQVSDPESRQKVRKPLAPRENVTPTIELEQTGSSDSVRGDMKVSENPNRQKRIHEMSLLLKRLESQLDGMNAPG